MKFACLLLIVCLCVVAADDRPSIFDKLINVPNIKRAQRVQKKQSSPKPTPTPRPTSPDNNGRYHFSWEKVPTEFSWIKAINYCNNLGPGWEGISINTKEEDQIVREKLIEDKVKYIWTGGFKNGNHWLWPRGNFNGFGWSHSGGLKKPQPDDRAGGENCLSVLNNFYGDGVNWHDVQCHHKKAVICEKNF